MKAGIWITEFIKQNRNLLDVKLLEQFGIKCQNQKKQIKGVKKEDNKSGEKRQLRKIVSQKGKLNFPQKKQNYQNLKKKVEGQSKIVESQSQNQDSNVSEKDIKVFQKKSQALKTRRISRLHKEPQQKRQIKIEKKEQKQKEKISNVQKQSVNALRAEMQKKLKVQMQKEKTNQQKIDDKQKISQKEKQKAELAKYFSNVELRKVEKQSENRQYPESFCQKIANKLDQAFKNTITKILDQKSEELCLDQETLKKFYKEYGTFLSLSSENKCQSQKFDKEEVVQRKSKPDEISQKKSNLNNNDMKKIEEKSNFQQQFLKLAQRSQSSLGRKVRNEMIEIKKPVEKFKQKQDIYDEINHKNLQSVSYTKNNMNQHQKSQYHQEVLKKPTQADRVQNTSTEKIALNPQKEKFRSLPLPPPPLPSSLPIDQSQNNIKPSSIIMNPYEYLSSKLLGFIERHQECTESDVRKCAFKIATKSPKIQGKIKQENLQIWIINFLKNHKNMIKGSKSGPNGLLNQPPQKSQISQNFTSPTPKIMIKSSPAQNESNKTKIPMPSQFIKKGNEINRGINQQKLVPFSKIPNRMPNQIHSKTSNLSRDHHFD